VEENQRGKDGKVNEREHRKLFLMELARGNKGGVGERTKGGGEMVECVSFFSVGQFFMTSQRETVLWIFREESILSTP